MSIVPSFFGARSNNAAYDPLSLDVWDPFEGFPFNSDMWPLSGNFFLTGDPRIDWKETADGHVYKVDVPGLKKEDVKVELGDDRVLQISSERNREEEGNGDTWRWVERSRGRFMRRIRLPENAKVNEMTGAMEDGVLTITVPKEGGKKPDVKSIEITEID